MNLHTHRVKMAQLRQSRPDFGLGFQVNVLQTLSIVPERYRFGLDEVGERVDARVQTYKTVMARFWLWLAIKCPQTLGSCSMFARERYRFGRDEVGEGDVARADQTYKTVTLRFRT